MLPNKGIAFSQLNVPLIDRSFVRVTLIRRRARELPVDIDALEMDLTGRLDLLQIQLLHFLTSPRRSAQEFQAGLDAGVVGKAAYWHGGPHRFPPDLFGELRDHHFKGDAVQARKA